MLLHEKAPGRALPGRTDASASGRRASGARRGRSSEDERAALEEERAVRRRVRAWRGERQCRRREDRGRRDHRRPSGRRRRLHLRDGRARGRRLPGRAAAGRDGTRPLVLAPLLLLTAAGCRRRTRRQARTDARGGEENGREGGDHARRARPGHTAIVPGWIRAVKLRARSVRGSATPPSRAPPVCRSPSAGHGGTPLSPRRHQDPEPGKGSVTRPRNAPRPPVGRNITLCNHHALRVHDARRAAPGA